MIKNLKSPAYMQSYGQTLSAQVTPSSFSTTNMTKMMAIFLGRVKELPSLWQLPEVLRVSEWDEWPQWSGSWTCNLLAKIEFIRCGWLRWREWGCVGLAAPRQIVWPLREQTRVRQYPPAVTAIKISSLLPGAMLTSKSGERLDRPQPGLT